MPLPTMSSKEMVVGGRMKRWQQGVLQVEKGVRKGQLLLD
jgi:hypothetical protein